MLKNIVVIGLVAVIAACGSTDSKAKLDQLKKERLEITSQIELLEAELGESAVVKVKAIDVSTSRIGLSQFDHFTEVHGTVDSDNNIMVPAESSGIVKKIYVKEGDYVSKGTLLAQIDDELVRRSLEQLETNLQLVTTVFERQQRLWNQEIGSEIQYLESKANKESLEKQYAAVQKQLDMFKIVAPISGTIDKIIINENEGASAGMGTIRVVNISDLKIVANLSEAYIGGIKEGNSVSVNIPAIEEQFRSTITAVAKVIDPDTRMFAIEIALSLDHKGVKPNMLAEVVVNDYTNPSALVLPQAVVQNSGTGNFIFKAVKQDGKWVAKRAEVEVGKYQGDYCEILGGLSENDIVISEGFQKVGDNTTINIVE